MKLKRVLLTTALALAAAPAFSADCTSGANYGKADVANVASAAARTALYCTAGPFLYVMPPTGGKVTAIKGEVLGSGAALRWLVAIDGERVVVVAGGGQLMANTAEGSGGRYTTVAGF